MSSGVFIVKFEHISHLLLVFIVDFEQVNVSWVAIHRCPREYFFQKCCEKILKYVHGGV